MIDIQAALDSLRTAEESVRRQVVEELGRSGQAEAILPLLMAVGDESWPVRQAAAELLAAFDDSALLPSLEAALRDDENAALRNAAMEIYVKMGAAASGAVAQSSFRRVSLGMTKPYRRSLAASKTSSLPSRLTAHSAPATARGSAASRGRARARRAASPPVVRAPGPRLGSS